MKRLRAVEILDIAPGLWIWRVRHPAWRDELDWDPFVTSVCVASGGEVAVLDPMGEAPWERLDAEGPTLVAVLKPDHVRDVDLFVRRYGIPAYGPYLFWRDDVPET